MKTSIAFGIDHLRCRPGSYLFLPLFLASMAVPVFKTATVTAEEVYVYRNAQGVLSFSDFAYADPPPQDAQVQSVHLQATSSSRANRYEDDGAATASAALTESMLRVAQDLAGAREQRDRARAAARQAAVARQASLYQEASTYEQGYGTRQRDVFIDRYYSRPGYSRSAYDQPTQTYHAAASRKGHRKSRPEKNPPPPIEARKVTRKRFQPDF